TSPGFPLFIHSFMNMMYCSLSLITPTTHNAVDCVLGGSCILPCSFPPGGEVVLYWIQVATGNTIHYFYNNQDQVELQDQHFRGRTSLFKDQISRGNASLRLTGVQIQDQGRYRCYTRSPAAQRGSTLNLRSPGPPSLRLTRPSRTKPQSSRLSSSSTASAAFWWLRLPVWTTAAPSALE
uniref:Ig-like domain-containing protein n=1 Tax=Cyclopterus lumpus TaxID=8103 RepID=A0A8C3B2F8_CYCLU